MEPPEGTTLASSLSAAVRFDDEQQQQHEEKVTVSTLRIAVGSSNPAKLGAVQQALQRAVDRPREGRANRRIQLEIQGFDVASGVPDQPWGDAETKRGAQNRARAAYQEYIIINHGNNNRAPHLAIGLEGGLEWLDRGNNNSSNSSSSSAKKNQDLFCMAWMAVYGKREALSVDCLASADTPSYTGDRKPVFGLAKTSLFPIPDAVAELVKHGVELGDADDQVFRRVKSKHGNGVVGILSDGLIDRSAYYEHAITLALLPWIRPDLYPDGN